MTRWDLVYKWSDPETQSLVDAVTSALENCDRKLNEAEARAASASVPLLDWEQISHDMHTHFWPGSVNPERHTGEGDCYKCRLMGEWLRERVAAETPERE